MIHAAHNLLHEASPPFQEASLEEIVDVIRESTLLNLVPQDERRVWYWQQLEKNTRNAYETDPELVSMMTESSLEGMHATRSGSLLSILQNGIIPASLHDQLPIPVITGEHHTQRNPRDATHFVHWLYASSTKRFAEDATSDNSDVNLSIHNYHDALGIDDSFIEQISPNMAVRVYLEKRKAAAQRFEAWLQSGAATQAELELHRKNDPVLIGFSLDDLDPSLMSTTPDSYVKGDLKTSQSIPSTNVRLIAVPESSIAEIEDYIPSQDRALLIALERIRECIPVIY